MAKYSTQNELILKKLLSYYEDNDYKKMREIIPIITGESSVSIRLIDWFVTNYAKKNFTQYRLTKESGETVRFNVYLSYKLCLKSYNKRRFDPFQRWDRIHIPFGNNQVIQTTLGQLNFFKWALENKILEYIKDHKNEIEMDMNTNNSIGSLKKRKRENQGASSTKTRKKREELSISAVKTIHKEDVKVTVSFK